MNVLYYYYHLFFLLLINRLKDDHINAMVCSSLFVFIIVDEKIKGRRNKKKVICDIPNDNLCVFNHMIVMRTLIMRESEKKHAC